MFLSFPSTKDPTYSQRFPGKSTVAIVTIAPYEWFQEWENERVLRRGDEYIGIKTALANQMWEQVRAYTSIHSTHSHHPHTLTLTHTHTHTGGGVVS